MRSRDIGAFHAPDPRTRQLGVHIPSWYLSFTFCSLVALVLLAQNESYRHWFLIPVLACGIVLGNDAFEWLRGRLDTFDSVGIIGLFGLHFFFVVPLLHVGWDLWLWTSRWSSYLPTPADWRVWTGWMAVVNLIGLAVYSATWRGICKPNETQKPTEFLWRIVDQRFIPILTVALLVTAVAQLLVYARFGGIIGYIEAFESQRFESFRGLGPLFMVTESFPILAMLGYGWFAARHKWARGWTIILTMLVLFFVMKIFFGGLRGSRSNTIWGIFWAVGIVHFWLRPVPRKLITVGLTALFAFMYVYGMYKSLGREAVQVLEGQARRAQLERRTGRSIENLLLGDLGRTDIQAFILYALQHPDSNYQLAWGRTYAAAMTLIIPRSVWPDRPHQSVKENTEILLGRGNYHPGSRVSSRVSGLVGEWMLNFPYFVAPLCYVVLGLLVGWVRRLNLRLRPFDTRLLAMPFLINLCFMNLVADSSNIVFFIFKNGFLPLGIILIGSGRFRVESSE